MGVVSWFCVCCRLRPKVGRTYYCVGSERDPYIESREVGCALHVHVSYNVHSKRILVSWYS